MFYSIMNQTAYSFNETSLNFPFSFGTNQSLLEAFSPFNVTTPRHDCITLAEESRTIGRFLSNDASNFIVEPATYLATICCEKKEASKQHTQTSYFLCLTYLKEIYKNWKGLYALTHQIFSNCTQNEKDSFTIQAVEQFKSNLARKKAEPEAIKTFPSPEGLYHEAQINIEKLGISSSENSTSPLWDAWHTKYGLNASVFQAIKKGTGCSLEISYVENIYQRCIKLVKTEKESLRFYKQTFETLKKIVGHLCTSLNETEKTNHSTKNRLETAQKNLKQCQRERAIDTKHFFHELQSTKISLNQWKEAYYKVKKKLIQHETFFKQIEEELASVIKDEKKKAPQ